MIRSLAAVFLAVICMMLASARAFAEPVDVSKFEGKIKVACVGDSITAGAGTTPGNSYPQQLGKMLGDKWDVKNFGVGGATLLNAGDKPYQKQGAFTSAVALKADVVIVMLGTNDTKPQNWKSIDGFAADYKDLVAKLTAGGNHPRVFIARPCVVLRKGAFGITQENMVKELPMIDAVAKELRADVVDIHAVTAAAAEKNPGLIPDTVHPNSDGAAILASTFYQALTGKAYTGPSTVLPPPPPKPATTKPATPAPATK